jgi:hypothetical protein
MRESTKHTSTEPSLANPRDDRTAGPALSMLLMAKKKNAAAVELGKRGAKARLTKLTPEHRSEIAKKAAAARWGKKGK